MNKKILMIGVVLLAICISVGAVSAWEWNFSSESSSNTDGGDMSLENGVLKLQGIEFKIPDGYKNNESAQVLGDDAPDIPGAKFSALTFLKGEDKIITEVFYADGGIDEFNSTSEGAIDATMAGIKGTYIPDEIGDGHPTFKFIKDKKLVAVRAPDNATIESILKA